MLLSKFGVDKKYLAHTPNELLIDHSNLTLAYYNKIIKIKNLDLLIDNLIHQIDSKNFEFIKEMFINAIYLHDLGKKNPCFQAKKMNNPLFTNTDCGDSSHSHSGAIEFIEYYKAKIENIQDDKEFYRLIYILYSFAYHINQHHGSLNTIEQYLAQNEERKKHPYFANVKKDIDTYLDKKFEFYILNKLLFSLLVSSDYYATTEYMAKLQTNDFGIFTKEQKQNFMKIFQEHIAKFQNPQGINKLRVEMFQEAEKNLLASKDKNIFYLEAPTGSGKTLTSINLALQLLNLHKNLNKLFYVFPFNTLVEQTKSVFEDIFGLDSIELINSITPIKAVKDQEDEESKYEKSYINRLFFHSPAVITTHVALFDILFGTSKEDNFPLWQLANSVIILDEIQTYNNQLWWHMSEFFDKYAQLLNIKIIIMSATLPKLDTLLKSHDSFVPLITNRSYFFENTLFKDRVKVDFSNLHEKMSFDALHKLLEAQPKNKKILIEFIKKQSAREFYNLIKDKFENVYELSGDDNKAYRQYVINKSRAETLIIVATQVIEAGVDIDMDIGFKDISTIDSEEQFMGRINRNCLREGIVYFFDMDSAENIYRGDHRIGFDLTQYKYQEILKNKNFHEYYKEVLQSIQNDGNRIKNGFLTKYEEFEGVIKKLNYKELAKTMKLINSQNFTLYFPFLLDLTKYHGVKEFEDIDPIFLSDKHLDGKKVWDEFRKLDKIENFTQKMYEKSKINALMQFFTFNILRFQAQEMPPYFTDIYGGFYYIEDLSYISDDGKFDRSKYLAKKDDLFL